jgi:flagellar biogenesis protein FliO
LGRGPKGEEPPPLPANPGATSGATSGATTGLALIALLSVGALAWWKRRRPQAAAPGEAIEMLAQSSLGGRARAMWLRAGERNMVVAVTAQAVQVLASWPSHGEAADAALAATSDEQRATRTPLYPRRSARTALRAARPSSARCRPGSRRRGEEDPP